MDIPLGDALKHIPFIILGIWPVNLLTLWAQGHAWGWDKTPDAIMGVGRVCLPLAGNSG